MSGNPGYQIAHSRAMALLLRAIKMCETVLTDVAEDYLVAAETTGVRNIVSSDRSRYLNTTVERLEPQALSQTLRSRVPSACYECLARPDLATRPLRRAKPSLVRRTAPPAVRCNASAPIFG